jgi:hypothetical protein
MAKTFSYPEQKNSTGLPRGTFRHFGPRILNLQIKSTFLTGKLSF